MDTLELISPPRSAIGLCPERPAVQDFDHRTPPARRKPVSAHHWKPQKALVLSVPVGNALSRALFALGLARYGGLVLEEVENQCHESRDTRIRRISMQQAVTQ